MNEKYVTNLELSKALKEIGCPQVSEFYWVDIGDKRFSENKEYWVLVDADCASARKSNGKGTDIQCSAYLSDELLEMLPKIIDKFSLLIRYKDWGEWEVSYTIFEIGLSHSDIKWWERDKSLPIALVKILLYLHKEGLVKW